MSEYISLIFFLHTYIPFTKFLPGDQSSKNHKAMNRSGSKCVVRGIPSVSGVSRPSAAPVEGLYCKRPIQCLASSKMFTPPPTPSPHGECVPPAFGAGGGHTRWVERGWGVSVLEDARHCSCSTYVSILCAWPRPSSPVPDHYTSLNRYTFPSFVSIIMHGIDFFLRLCIREQ
jgi:hypothetical protein